MVNILLIEINIGIMVRVFANGSGELGSLPGLSYTKDYGRQLYLLIQ